MKPRKKKKRQFRQLFARSLQRLAPARSGSAEFSGPLRSVAILAQEKLGDCVLLTPLVRNLRCAFPDLEIHLIAFSRASASFFMNDPAVTAVHLVKKQPQRYFREVLSRKFDLLFNTKDHPSTHFLLQSALIRARFKVGHKNPFHEGLYDRLLDLEFHSHMAAKNCALLPLLGVADTETCRPSLPAMPVSNEIRQLLRHLDGLRPIGINISAGQPNRYWTEEKWKTLLGSFPGERFVVLSGPDDVESKQRLEEKCRNVIETPPTNNLYEASLIVSKLRLLVTPDTSMVHVASGAGIPVVGLYREAPQDISRFGPYAVPYELVVSTTGEVSGVEPGEVASAVRRLTARAIGKEA
ncbi:glycosyltransferase family 9 protein [Chlorobaculum sp. MV4-Y]|uniref:glycosyltransferase family 9 protein n=1 Tax=Chlorobaculum sp. MV4-Y TaxID=2976335 RepID=UPI0021AF14C9|nr:glycosyltransferase family 9 protein [Chlorobaculum sp. MV4-Y]UWX57858.1 glycosyltransferase family 9 protein [Chlorobaculum sp. MV4-Y]